MGTVPAELWSGFGPEAAELHAWGIAFARLLPPARERGRLLIAHDIAQRELITEGQPSAVDDFEDEENLDEEEDSDSDAEDTPAPGSGSQSIPDDIELPPGITREQIESLLEVVADYQRWLLIGSVVLVGLYVLWQVRSRRGLIGGVEELGDELGD